MPQHKTRDLVSAYYDCWTKGLTAKVDVERLRTLLVDQLEFEGPVAGKRAGAAAFVEGVTRIGQRLKSFRQLQAVFDEHQAAVAYEAELTEPPGLHRFAEFFELRDGKIQSLRLYYDATAWRAVAPK